MDFSDGSGGGVYPTFGAFRLAGTEQLRLTPDGPQAASLTMTTGSTPTCSVTYRGRLVFVAGGTGVSDHLFQCYKDATDTYSYRTVY